jgi:hypothetical protein
MHLEKSNLTVHSMYSKCLAYWTVTNSNKELHLQTRVSREQRPCNQRRLVGAKIAAQCCIMPSDPGNPFFLTLSSVMQNAYTQWLTCWRLDSLGIVLGQSHFCVCVWLLKSVLWWQSHASNDIRGVLCGFPLFVRSMCGLHMYVICFRKKVVCTLQVVVELWEDKYEYIVSQIGLYKKQLLQ